MKIIALKGLFGCLSIGIASVALAQSLSLGAVSDSDVRPAQLRVAPTMPLANERRETVAFSWSSTDTSVARSAPYVAISRSYQRTVRGAALAKGVALTSTAPGALIRVSSSDRRAALNLDNLNVVLATGRSVSARAASDQLVSGDDLRAAGLAADPRSIGLRLAPELGAGEFRLQSAAAIDPEAQVLIDVFDRNSDLLLSVQSAAEQFFTGTHPEARIALTRAGSGQAWRSISAVVVGPNGQRHAANVDMASGDAVLRTKTPIEAATGLWEWHVWAISDTGVERQVRTAFAAAHPVARFDNSATVQRADQDVQIALGVQVSTPGRYEARGTLLATDASGQQRVAMIGAVASWLEPGSDVLTLAFDTTQLKRHGLSAPYALADLQLTDQSRMGVLETRRKGVTF